MSDPPAYRQFAVRGAGAIWRPTNAPLVVVVGGRDEYDTVARMTLDRGARPGTLIPIWWQDTADRVPNDLLQRAQAVVIEDGRFGDRAAAERSLAAYATSGGRVLLDAHGSNSSLSALWPVNGATDEAIADWRLHAAAGNLAVQGFSPARYDDGPWNAPVGTALRADARVILDQDGRPLVAERPVGTGAVVWVGGNLLYHAKAYGNDIESDFLFGLFGPLGRDASVAGDANRLDAERVTVRSSGARGIFVSESFHPKWTARWSDGSAHLADRDLERVRTEPQHAAEPLEGRERSRRVVAHAVEAIGEREVRRRALPAFIPEARSFERGAKRSRCEVEEVLARLVVIPKAAEESRL